MSNIIFPIITSNMTDIDVTDANTAIINSYQYTNIVIEPHTFIDSEGNRIYDLEEIYKHVSKLYFDKQMKEIIEDDTTTKA